MLFQPHFPSMLSNGQSSKPAILASLSVWQEDCTLTWIHLNQRSHRLLNEHIILIRWKLLNCDNFFCVHHSMNSPNTLQILIIVGSTNSSLNTTTTCPIISNMTCLCNIALNYMCPFAKVWFVLKWTYHMIRWMPNIIQVMKNVVPCVYVYLNVVHCSIRFEVIRFRKITIVLVQFYVSWLNSNEGC